MRRLTAPLHRLWAWAAHRRDRMVTAALDEPDDPHPWDPDLDALLRESFD